MATRETGPLSTWNELKSGIALVAYIERPSRAGSGEYMLCRQLGWEAATERLLEAAEIRPQQHCGRIARVSEFSLWALYRWFLGEYSAGLKPAQPALDMLPLRDSTTNFLPSLQPAPCTSHKGHIPACTTSTWINKHACNVSSQRLGQMHFSKTGLIHISAVAWVPSSGRHEMCFLHLRARLVAG